MNKWLEGIATGLRFLWEAAEKSADVRPGDSGAPSPELGSSPGANDRCCLRGPHGHGGECLFAFDQEGAPP